MKKSITLFGRLILVVFVHLYFFNTASAQFDVLPCTDPNNNGIGCYCETAGIICTPDELDGFEFSMSDVSNSGGLSGDLCPGLPDGGNPNNVNYFAFVAWCETLTFDALVTNCTPGTNTGNNVNNFGIQMALFANCPAENGGQWDPIECVTNGSETCFNSAAEVPTSQTFTASGLEIGGTYYFMVDGCFQSICDVTIDVQGACGTGEITLWENGIFGPQNVCIGNTETYIAEDIVDGLDGAEEYYYYIDGVIIDEGEEQYTIDITWDNPGSYELCVDVSNLPCIPVSDGPPLNCITIIVNGTENGDIQAVPTTLCPSEPSTITVVDTNFDPALSEYIIITLQDGTVIKIVEALTTTLAFPQCGELTAYYYSFVTDDDPLLPSMGDFWTAPDCVANCCSVDEIDIMFEDTETPIFSDAPANITLDCVDDISEDEELAWTDNCIGSGTVMPSVEENYTLCDGGTIEKTWAMTDYCANMETYTQVITIDPLPEADFLAPPQDSTILCDAAQDYIPSNLSYSNMASGICEISGTVSPTSTGNFDLCGGVLTYTWEFTDLCGRTTSHSQVINVDPISEAFFVNPPTDITISCDEIETFIPDTLMYSNGGTGDCLIEGIITPTSDDLLDTCGVSATYEWEYTDLCGRSITHIQTVTVDEDVLHSVYSGKGEKEINVFPNPFNNQVTIDEDGLKRSDIVIYNLSGEDVSSMVEIRLHAEHVVIEAGKLKDGMYILKIRSDSQLIIKY